MGRVLPVAFRDVHPSHRRRLVRARLEAIEQRPEVLLQIRRVLRRRLAVDAERSVLARASVGLVQQLQVDVMGQRREHHLRCFLASSAIRCSLVETLSGLDVPCIFPSSGSVARPPLPSTGPSGRFPCFVGTVRRLRLPAALPASLRCLRSALTAVAPFFAPAGSSRRPRAWACHGSPVRFTAGDDRISQVPGEPPVRLPRSSTPAGPRRLALAALRCCRRSENDDGSQRSVHFEAQSRGFRTPCVRFAAGVTPAPRNTRFRLVASLCRADLSRRVPLKVSVSYMTSSFPGFAWRTIQLNLGWASWNAHHLCDHLPSRNHRSRANIRGHLLRLALQSVEEPGQHLGPVFRGHHPGQLDDAGQTQPPVRQRLDDSGKRWMSWAATFR